MINQSVTSRGLYEHAETFSAAAEVVLESRILDLLPTYFVWGRAIELVLQRFLLAEGVSVARLNAKAFGRDLVTLMRAAEARGIASIIELNHTYHGVVQLLNFDYASKYF